MSGKITQDDMKTLIGQLTGAAETEMHFSRGEAVKAGEMAGHTTTFANKDGSVAGSVTLWDDKTLYVRGGNGEAAAGDLNAETGVYTVQRLSDVPPSTGSNASTTLGTFSAREHSFQAAGNGGYTRKATSGRGDNNADKGAGQRGQ